LSVFQRVRKGGRMKINKGWKEIYKNLSWYNRRKFIEANRPFGKDPKEFNELVMWCSRVCLSSVLFERA